MRVLVAGASGVIGRPLVAALSSRGHTVIGLSRRPGTKGVVADVLDRDATVAAELPGVLDSADDPGAAGFSTDGQMDVRSNRCIDVP